MVIIDPNNLIFSLISALLGRVITSDEYLVSEPIAALGPYNTEVILRPKLKGSYYAVHSLRYNRIDINDYSPIYVNKGGSSNVSDLLPAINRVAGFTSSIAVNHLDQLVTFTVPPLRREDIVDRQLLSTDPESVYLLLDSKSYLFTGTALLSSIKPPVIVELEVVVKKFNAAAFVDFEVTQRKIIPASFYTFEAVEKNVSPPVLTSLEVVVTKLLPIVPVVDSFSVFPTQTRINETISLSFNLRHLDPNKSYVGYIYHRTGAVAFEGNLFYKTLAFTPVSPGDVLFSVAIPTPIEVTQTKLFLLITESTNTLPNKTVSGQIYSEILRSKEIDLSANQPNTYYTSVMFAFLVEENLSVSQPVALNGSLTTPVSDLMSISNSSIVGAVLRETITFVSKNIIENSKLQLTNGTIESGTLVTTINYLERTSVEINKLTLSIPAINSGTLT